MRRAFSSEILMIIFCVVTIPLVCQAQKASEGMGGLKWGDPPEKFLELKEPTPWSFSGGEFFSSERDGKKIGRRFIDRLGEVRTAGIASYGFDHERFASFTVGIDPSDFSLLKESLIARYGRPISETPLVLKVNPNATVGTEIRWRPEGKVEVTLSKDELNKEVQLNYFYLGVIGEKIKEQRESVEKTKDSL